MAVGEELHFGRAAARLHIAQPSLSRAIRELEASLGVELLVRTKRSVRLTDAGKMLLGEAPAALDVFEQCLARTRRVGKGELGEITVGFLPSVTAVLLPQVVTAFRASHPDVHLELREMLDDPLLEGLRSSRIDVGILRSCVDEPDLVFELLLDDPIHVVLPLGHRLAARRRLRFADLRDEPFVLWPRSQSREGYDDVLRGCRAAGFEPSIVQECALPYTTLGLVAAGAGISVLSGLFRAFRTDVAFVPLDRPRDAIYLGWQSASRSVAMDAFVELVRGVGAAAGELSSRRA